MKRLILIGLSVFLMGAWLKMDQKENDVNLRLPVVKPPFEIPVIELVLEK